MDIANFKMIVLLAFSILRLLVAIPLFMTARRNRLNNLYWLSANFLCLVIAVPFAAAGTLNVPWIFWTFISLTEITLIMFVHTTFYQGRKSPMPVFMGITLLGMLGGIYGNITNNFVFSAWSVYPIAALVWAWHFAEAYRAYGSVESDASTEDWVKARYTLMITYSVLDFVSALLGTATTTGIWDNSLSSLIVVAINIISVIIQMLTWVMPEWFRRWLNRNQQTRIEQQSTEHINAIMNAFGTAMSTDTGLTRFACLYVIRNTLSKTLGTDDTDVVGKHILAMTYQEWQTILQSPDLYQALLKTNPDESSVRKAIQNAQRALVDKQSLITLSAQ